MSDTTITDLQPFIRPKMNEQYKIVVYIDANKTTNFTKNSII